VIKYLGSKRRLVPVLEAIARAAAPRTALDLCCGTTRVAQAFKRAGAEVTAVDHTRAAHVLARCHIATDATALDVDALSRELARLDALPGRPGYVTEVFCRQARYFQPANGERIDAIRAAIATGHAGSPWEPVLLASLLAAADRVDSTTGVQMAYLKSWAPRASKPLELRLPALLPGPGHAVRGDAVSLAADGTLGPFDLAYLDPPYNQHAYVANYHVWETIVAADEPPHYGVACKRTDTRSAENTSPFNRRATMPAALASVVAAIDSGVLAVSYNDESWLTLDDLRAMCEAGGRHVEAVGFDSPRYVGARIGIHNPAGEKVGRVGRTRNVEWLVLAGTDRSDVERLAAVARTAKPIGLHPVEV
jgi:adenine-specific DNA-methyltransferase